MNILCYAILAALGLGAMSAQAATYYVATTGNNTTNDCTEAQTLGTPKQTIGGSAGGISCAAANGDRVEVRGGTYIEAITSATTPGWTSGSSGSPKTLANYNNEVVIIQPSGGAHVFDFNLAAGPQWWILDGTTPAGMIVDGRNLGNGANATSAVGLNPPAANNTLRNLTIRNTSNNGGTGFVSNAIFSTADNLSLINIIVNSTHDNWSGSTGDNAGSHGLYLSGSNLLLTRSTITGAGLAGVQLNDSNGPTPHTNGVITRNTIYNNGLRSTGTGKTGIVLNNYIQTTLVAANLVSTQAGGPGIAVYGTVNSGNLLYNNTIVGNASTCIDVGQTSATGTRIDGNICQGNGTGIAIRGSAVNTVLGTNVAYSTGTAYSNSGTNTTPGTLILTNPLLANVSTRDYHLLSSSSAINACNNLTATVPLDYAGTTYTVPMECGAYNSGTAVTPLVLSFATPPTTTLEDTVMTPAVRVCARDSGGVLQTSFANNITLTISTNPGSSTCTGCGATAPSSGCATFNVSLNNDDVGYKLTAAATGASSVISAAFNITAAAVVLPVPFRAGRIR